jgi:hypothetical protein
VATIRSIQRNWVWFESGVFWFDRPIIICCCGELRPEALPPPLNERQATALSTGADARLLLEQLSEITGVAVADTTDLDSFANRFIALERTAQSLADQDKRWVGVAWQDNFLVCDGPIEDLNLIDPDYYQESMKRVLEEAGFRLVLIRRDQIGEFKDRGFRPVYITDKKKWRKEVQKGDVLLVAQARAKS